MKKFVFIFLVLILAPMAVSFANYLLGDRGTNWQTADRSSAGLLPKPSDHPDALVRVFAARTVRWRGIFAVHTWIVMKERGWFGAVPETVVSADGERAETLIPKIRSVIENYSLRSYGDYNAWPGPNSNTFIQAILDQVPEMKAVLPPTAIGKDYPYRGNWYGLTSSRTGLFLSLGGYIGLTIGWLEGVELNFLGAVLGIDIRRPALKFPGIGRVGLPSTG